MQFRIERRRWKRRRGEPLQLIRPKGRDRVFVDVFDTVLVRRTTRPDDVLVFASRRALSDAPPESRDASSSAALIERRHAATLFGRLEDMAKHVGNLVATVDADRWIQAEEEIESQLCVAVPGARKWLRGLRQRGHPITFVSDMHLSTETIRALLRQNELIEPGDGLVVSSDWGRTKRAGDLFPAVLDEIGVDAADVHHVGNDLVADGQMPRAAGMSVHPISTGNPNRFERVLTDGGRSPGPLIAGAVRLARLSLDEPQSDQPRGSSADPNLVRLGSGVGGAAVTGFLVWCLERARSEEIDTLYFLARDGKIIMEMARALPADYTEGIELRYLHASRRVTTLASVPTGELDEWIRRGTASATSRLIDGSGRVPFRNLCERLGLDPADIAPRLRQPPTPDRPLSPSQVEAYVSLLQDPSVQAMIRDAAIKERTLVQQYLHQQGLDRGSVGLVDVGWTGQLAESICRLARPEDPFAIRNFHIGSLPVDPAPQISLETFLPEGASDRIRGLVVCVETFTASADSPAVGFEERSGQIVPRFGSSPERDGPTDDRTILQRAMVETARQLPARTSIESWLGPDIPSLGHQVERLLGELWLHPDPADAETLSQLVFEADESGRVTGALAQPITLRTLKVRRPWGQGSVVRSKLGIRVAARVWAILRKHLSDRRSETYLVSDRRRPGGVEMVDPGGTCESRARTDI